MRRSCKGPFLRMKFHFVRIAVRGACGSHSRGPEEPAARHAGTSRCNPHFLIVCLIPTWPLFGPLWPAPLTPAPTPPFRQRQQAGVLRPPRAAGGAPAEDDAVAAQQEAEVCFFCNCRALDSRAPGQPLFGAFPTEFPVPSRSPFLSSRRPTGCGRKPGSRWPPSCPRTRLRPSLAEKH